MKKDGADHGCVLGSRASKRVGKSLTALKQVIDFGVQAGSERPGLRKEWRRALHNRVGDRQTHHEALSSKWATAQALRFRTIHHILHCHAMKFRC